MYGESALARFRFGKLWKDGISIYSYNVARKFDMNVAGIVKTHELPLVCVSLELQQAAACKEGPWGKG